ncbi:MAG: DMT family transporter, partial [Thermoplasmatales archaeon]
MDKRVAYVGLVFVAAVWGATFPIIKETLLYIGPISFLFFRFALASVIMMPFVVKKIRKKDAIYGTIVGIPLALGYITQTIGLQYTSPSMSGLITGIYVVLTPILSIFILRIPKDPVKIYLAMTAFAGMALMTVSSTSGETLGNILTVFTAVFYALQIVLTEKYLGDGDPLVFTFFEILIVAVFSLIFDPLSVINSEVLGNGYVLFSVIFNGAVGSFLAIWIMTVAIREISGYVSALILVLEPVFAVLISTLVFHFRISSLMLVGGAIIVTSMFLAIRRENKKSTVKT